MRSARRTGSARLSPGIFGAMATSTFAPQLLSVGASGAVFGLIGSTLGDILLNWDSGGRAARWIHLRVCSVGSRPNLRRPHKSEGVVGAGRIVPNPAVAFAMRSDATLRRHVRSEAPRAASGQLPSNAPVHRERRSSCDAHTETPGGAQAAPERRRYTLRMDEARRNP